MMEGERLHAFVVTAFTAPSAFIGDPFPLPRDA